MERTVHYWFFLVFGVITTPLLITSATTAMNHSATQEGCGLCGLNCDCEP